MAEARDVANRGESRRIGRWLAVAIAVSMCACALSSSDHYSDGVCAVGAKLCGDICVSASDPDFGCASAECAPCNLSRASATCAAGQCAVSVCYPGRADCNSDPKDGCEADTSSSTDTCGSCSTRCQFTNAVPACNKGICAILVCNERFGDCNGRVSDGCETDLRLPSSCGACGASCPSPRVCREYRISDRWTALCEDP